MIKKVHTFFIFLVLSSMWILPGCGKKGCADSDAINFSTSAKKDDGTCRYEGAKVFWVSKSTAQQMISDSIESIVVYIDGDVEGRITLLDQRYTAAPDCDAAQAVTVKKDLFSLKNTAFTYEVFDNKNVKRWSSSFIINANTCEDVELLYFP